MWILECEGDVLQNKRLWLRPGKKYLFGRTKTMPGDFAIDNKSISRKHLTIEVSPVVADERPPLHAKSRLTVEDQKSKVGTRVNGEQILGRSKLLEGHRHEIQLGNFGPLFLVRWQPVVFSFSFSSKEQKQLDPLVAFRARLEPLGIQAISPYVVGATTHVVASKRNTAKGLQALIHAGYIVDSSFVDAIVDAATAQDPNDPESPCRLEEDYDSAWPDALQHLPAQSKEPSERPAAFFAPDKKRARVFDGYTFVFCDQSQFDNLQAPITNGGGKALLFQVDEGKTSPEEIVRFVKAAAGEKGLAEFEDGSEGKGVVVVRFRGKKKFEEWSIEVGNEVARSLDQRLIEQSEFLDAILVNDARGLRKPLPEEDDQHVVPAPRTAQAASLEAQQPPVVGMPDNGDAPVESQEEPLAKRIKSRRIVQSMFKGFDDGFDPASIPRSGPTRNPAPVDAVMEDEAASTPSRGTKRHPSVSDDEEPNDEELMDEMFPAAAAMKRRRIDQANDGSSQAAPKVSTNGSGTLQKGQLRRVQEVDVLGVARERREAVDEAALRDEEAYRASLGEVNVEQMRNLAVIEEMPVKIRSRTDPTTPNDIQRWDDRWNGRKNFKKFRRQGTSGQQPHRGRTVMVGLEEVRRKEFGIGDEYWLERDRPARVWETARVAMSASPSQTFATAQSELDMGETEDPVMPLEVDAPRRGRVNDRTGRSGTENKDAAAPSPRGKGKRSASGTISRAAPAKKQKTFLARDEESDESDDGLKFRFKKKR
ncbi:MAG: hypothetical protein M1838_002648 [Thelocarpon superellum]|nr:MAG: hypothetical protein M1838_002648 [Thelocarpon superellum]